MLESFQQFLDQITEILHLIKPRIQIGLAVVAMATLVPMTAFPQANESAKEVTSSVAGIAVGNTQQSSGENNTSSGFSKNSDFQTLPYIDENIEVEIQTRFNKIRRELLDEQALFIDRWLNVIAIVLAIFGVVIPIGGFMGFRRFREIEKEAKSSAENAAAAVDTAEHHLKEIRKKSDTATDLIEGIHAQRADENPTKATQTVTKIRDNPTASLIDRAIANAVSLQQQGKQKDAIKKWRAIAEITEESDNALAARACFSVAYLSSDKDVANKINFYNRAIQLKPNFVAAYINRGNSKLDLGQHNDAIEDYDKAIQLDPNLAEAYSNRGSVKRKLGRYKDAIEDFDKAIRLNPDMANHYSNRGNAKLDLGRHKDAIEDYDKAIQLDPNLAKFYSNRGNAKSNLGQHKDAIEDYDKAIQLDPNLAEPYCNRGNAKFQLEGNEDAFADYDKAIHLKPDWAVAYLSRGLSKMILGVKVAAKSDFETALRLAQNTNDVELIKLVEENLHSLNSINGD